RPGFQAFISFIPNAPAPSYVRGCTDLIFVLHLFYGRTPVSTLVSGVLFRDCGRGVRRPFQIRAPRHAIRRPPRFLVRGRSGEPHLDGAGAYRRFCRAPPRLAGSVPAEISRRRESTPTHIRCTADGRYRDDRGGATGARYRQPEYLVEY